MQLQHSAYKIQHLYKLCGVEAIDKIQKSEKERLLELIAYYESIKHSLVEDVVFNLPLM